MVHFHFFFFFCHCFQVGGYQKRKGPAKECEKNVFFSDMNFKDIVRTHGETQGLVQVQGFLKDFKDFSSLCESCLSSVNSWIAPGQPFWCTEQLRKESFGNLTLLLCKT